MQESGKNSWLLKKSYEIAYAAFRIAAKMSEREFAGYLKGAAISLLGAAAGDDHVSAKKRLVSLEYLIRFAMDVNIMGIVNGEIMLREIAGLDVAMTEAMIFTGNDLIDNGTGKAKNDEADIAGIFSEVDSVESPAIRQDEIRQNGESGNPAIRQAAILERIRQSGNCRIRDIQEVLPGSSERTIRYDLQTMVEQNLIERVGSGGPSVFYRIRGING